MQMNLILPSVTRYLMRGVVLLLACVVTGDLSEECDVSDT